MSDPQGSAATIEFDRLWSAYWLELQSAGPLTFTRYRLLMAEVPGDLPASPRVLDVGCGPGTFLRLLAGRLPGARVQGIEVSAAACAAAPENLKRHILNGDLLEVSGQLAGQAYDLVVCSEVLEHVEDPAQFLSCIVSLAAPGALLLFSVPAGMRHWSIQDDVAQHRRRFELAQFGALLRQAGLVVEHEYTWGGPVSALYNRAINALGPAQAAIAGGSRVGRLAARLLCTALRFDDLFRGTNRFQLIARARKPVLAP